MFGGEGGFTGIRGLGGDIAPRAEAFAGAGEDDAADGGIGGVIREEAGQALDHAGGQRVEAGGTVEGDNGDTIVHPRQNFLVHQ